MKEIAFLPDLIYDIAEKEQPHKLTTLTYNLASKLHSYYYHYKFLVDDEKLMKARLYLLKAVRSSLRTLFRLMEITPVERM